MAPEDASAAQGFALHEDRAWGFRFRYPADWHRFMLLENRQGVLYAPDPVDFATSFSVEVRDLGTRITRADVKDLRDGFRAALRALYGDGLVARGRALTGASPAIRSLAGRVAGTTGRSLRSRRRKRPG